MKVGKPTHRALLASKVGDMCHISINEPCPPIFRANIALLLKHLKSRKEQGGHGGASASPAAKARVHGMRRGGSRRSLEDELESEEDEQAGEEEEEEYGRQFLRPSAKALPDSWFRRPAKAAFAGKSFQVSSEARSKRLVAATFQDLKTKTAEKFGLAESSFELQELSGCSVEDDEDFQAVPSPFAVKIVLKEAAEDVAQGGDKEGDGSDEASGDEAAEGEAPERTGFLDGPC